MQIVQLQSMQGVTFALNPAWGSAGLQALQAWQQKLPCRAARIGQEPVVACWGELPESLQQQCQATLQISFHLHTWATSSRQLRKEATPQTLPLLTITSPQILHLSSQLCLGVTILSSSRPCLVRKTLFFSSGKPQACGTDSFNTVSGFRDTFHTNTRQSMDLLCELSRCLCLTFELGAIKVSKAETTIKDQSLWSQTLPT